LTKLLVVSPSLGEGGAQRVTSTLLANLDRERLAIELCLFKDVIEFPMPCDIPVTALADREVSLGRQPWRIPGALRRLRRLLRRSRPDVVLSVIDQANLVVAAALAGGPKVRWVARAGSNPALQSRTERLLTRIALARADRLIGNAEALVRELRQRHRKVADRVVYLPNPIDFDRLDRLAAEPPAHTRDPAAIPLIIWVGRMVVEKRPDVLIDAAAALKRRRPFHLWMCGGGALADSIAAQIRDRGLEGEVSALGFCENPYALCAQADVFVLTSEGEGLPNGLIEAQGLGLAAVSTDCRFGPSEIITHGETGLLTSVNDPLAIAAALDELLSAPDRRAEMAAAARRRVRARYGVDAVIDRWQRVLEGVD
jgi:glycosyltransferase involved in cell wall biosynthesis